MVSSSSAVPLSYPPATTAHIPPPASSMQIPYAPYQQQAGSAHYASSYSSGPWSYQYGGQPTQHSMTALAPRSYPVYHPNPSPTVAAHPANGFYYPPPPTFRGRSHANLQWQPSYTGPRPNHPSPNEIHYYQYPPQQQAPPITAPTSAGYVAIFISCFLTRLTVS